MENYFVNKKWEIFTRSIGRDFQEDNWWYPVSCWACGKENIFNLFNILKKMRQYYTHMRLYYRCTKIWIVKIWRIFGQSSILPNFCGTKVSLYTVCYKRNRLKSCLFYWFLSPLFGDHEYTYMHAYRGTLFESVMKTGLWTFTSRRKDIALLHKHEEQQ